MPDVRRQRSRRVGAAIDCAQVLEFLCRPLGLALFLEHVADRRSQFEEHLDVQRGVVEPFGRQRPLGPVGGAVSLHQPQTEQPLHHRGQVHPVEAGQPAGQLGVVQLRRRHADLGQTRQILVGGVQHPLVGGQYLGDRGQRRHRVAAVVDRVDQHRASAGAADLHQVGAVGVAEARRALGVDGERAVPDAKSSAARAISLRTDRQLGHAVARVPAVGWPRAPGCRFVGGRLGSPRRSSQARVREPRSVTPAGGRPAACSSTSQNACTCGPSSSVVAVHDARSSS